MASSKTLSLDSSKLNFSSAGISDQEETTTPIPSVKKSTSASQPTLFKTPHRKTQQQISKLLQAVPRLDEVFTITGKVGEGTFSSVFSAEVKKFPDMRQKFVIKHIIPTSHPDRIITELNCLRTIGGQANVMGIDCCMRERDHVVMVMKHFPHHKFQDYMRSMNGEEIQAYMKNLFLALQQVHKYQVIHRDIKPSNFLYNRKERRYALVDFGLAQKVSNPIKKSQEIMNKKASSSHQKVIKSGSTARPIILRGTKRKLSSVENQEHRDRVYDKTESRPSPRLMELDINTFINNAPKSTRLVPVISKPEMNEILQKAKRPRYGSQEIITKIAEKISKDEVVLKPRQKPSAPQRSSSERTKCECFGFPQVCGVCTARPNQIAPRAGTPGFRSPEVLLKYQGQTTAVDMWAAGVILLSILSGRYPFFHAYDDFTALAQIISIFGTEETKLAAKKLGKDLICNVNIKPLNLKQMCEKLRQGCSTGSKRRKSSPRLQNLQKRKASNEGGNEKKTTPIEGQASGKENNSRNLASLKNRTPINAKSSLKRCESFCFPDSAYDLLERLLDLDPHTRITATEALKHPFIVNALDTTQDKIGS